MRASFLRAACAAALAGCFACSELDAPAPSPTSVEPTRGWAADRTPIVIRGSGFVARTESPASGGDAGVVVAHRAWLGGTELEEVVRVDAGTLHATVPAGLPAGLQALVVENPFGRRGRLEGAFEVVSAPGAVLSGTIAADAVSVTVGQAFAVRATISNLGTATALGVTAALVASSGDGGAATVAGPTPASIAALAPGGSVELGWSCVATAAGQVSLALSLTGTDELSGREVEGGAAAPADVAVQLPAGLVATVAVSRTTANTGQAVTVTFTLTNGGGAAADVDLVVPLRAPEDGTTCTPPAPPPPVAVPAGEAAAFTWTCSASGAESLSLSGTAHAADAISGAILSATPAIAASVVVQTPAALSAAVSLPPESASASVGQALALTLVVSNGGGAGAELTGVVPTVAPAGAAACVAPSPTPAWAVAGGESAELAWTCTPAVAGVVTFGAIVAGRDVNTGASILASPASGASAAVQLPAALAAVVSASRAEANVGQPVNVTFTVTNGGSATAIVDAIEHTEVGGAAAGCGEIGPALPQAIASGGARTFTWTCTASTAGDLSLSGTALGRDANSGADLSATPALPASVAVVAPAALSATISLPPDTATASVGQPLALTLVISSDGGADAAVVGVAPTVTPDGAAACDAPAVPPGWTLAGGESGEVTWRCTPAIPGGVTFGATVSGRDANTGASLSASPAAGASATIQLPAALTAVVSASRATANVDQPVVVTFTVTNGAGAAAIVTSVEPAEAGAGGAVATCGGVDPPPPQPIASGGALAFTWTCAGSAAGDLSLSGAARGHDANSGADVSATPAAPASVLVQTPAALSATLAAPLGTGAFGVGLPLALTLVVTNGGGADAEVTGVAPSLAPEGAAACEPADPLPPQRVAGGGALELAWSCTPATPGEVVFGATVQGRDLNDERPLEAAAAGVPITIVSAPVGIAYSENPAVYTVGIAIAPNAPTAGTGSAADAWTVSPDLPPGLSLDPATGVVSGTPTAVAATGTYAVTAANAAGSTTIDLVVTVDATAALEASLSAVPANPAVNDPVLATLTVLNGGGAEGTITAVALSVTPAHRIACTPATAPPLPFAVGVGGSVELTWTCTAVEAGGATLHATVTGPAGELTAEAPLTVQ